MADGNDANDGNETAAPGLVGDVNRKTVLSLATGPGFAPSGDDPSDAAAALGAGAADRADPVDPVDAAVASVGPVPIRPIDGSLGTPTGFDAVFERERDAMVRLAYLLTGDDSAAEEIVQDAFVTLLDRWHRVDNPGGFVRACVVNGARSAHRRTTRDRRRLRAITDQRPPESTDLGARELLDALGALPPLRRAVVVLRFYGHLTQEEIAEALHLRLGTVKSNLHRGLADLRKALEP